ncbi:MAG: hypothetical protein CMO55_11210 [Verrucomicrobiales bacterium]|nr:hypothetical protein [Verrucomicrobiales bacterium]
MNKDEAWRQFCSLTNRRSELEEKGDWEAATSIQHEIIKASQRYGTQKTSQAWSRLGYIHHRNGQNELAEDAVRQAINLHDASGRNPEESLATLQFQLAEILATQNRFREAVSIGETAIENFSILHNPPTDFLASREAEIERMRAFRDKYLGEQ